MLNVDGLVLQLKEIDRSDYKVKLNYMCLQETLFTCIKTLAD